MDHLNGYAVIDLETTGFGKYDRVLEIGVVLLDAAYERVVAGDVKFRFVIDTSTFAGH